MMGSSMSINSEFEFFSHRILISAALSGAQKSKSDRGGNRGLRFVKGVLSFLHKKAQRPKRSALAFDKASKPSIIIRGGRVAIPCCLIRKEGASLDRNKEQSNSSRSHQSLLAQRKASLSHNRKPASTSHYLTQALTDPNLLLRM
jgi:hypothetical protein